MTLFRVGDTGNLSYEQALELVQKRGYGQDAIHAQGDEGQQRFDIIDRSTNQFIAKDVSAEEAARIQREAGDVATRAPAGQYTSPNFSYTPDRPTGRGSPRSSEEAA